MRNHVGQFLVQDARNTLLYWWILTHFVVIEIVNHFLDQTKYIEMASRRFDLAICVHRVSVAISLLYERIIINYIIFTRQVDGFDQLAKLEFYFIQLLLVSLLARLHLLYDFLS